MLGPWVVAQQHAETRNSVKLNDRCHNRGRPQSTLIPHLKVKSKKKADQFTFQYLLSSHAGILSDIKHRNITYSTHYSQHIQRSNALTPWISCCISIQTIISASSVKERAPLLRSQQKKYHQYLASGCSVSCQSQIQNTAFSKRA